MRILRASQQWQQQRDVLLREDFCGTALVCCEWVKRKKDRRAYGVDIDQPTLDWGHKFNLSRLSDAARDRITLVADDARKVSGPKADIIAAQNFSFQFFKQRGRDWSKLITEAK